MCVCAIVDEASTVFTHDHHLDWKLQKGHSSLQCLLSTSFQKRVFYIYIDFTLLRKHIYFSSPFFPIHIPDARVCMLALLCPNFQVCKRAQQCVECGHMYVEILLLLLLGTFCITTHTCGIGAWTQSENYSGSRFTIRTHTLTNTHFWQIAYSIHTHIHRDTYWDTHAFKLVRCVYALSEEYYYESKRGNGWRDKLRSYWDLVFSEQIPYDIHNPHTPLAYNTHANTHMHKFKLDNKWNSSNDNNRPYIVDDNNNTVIWVISDVFFAPSSYPTLASDQTSRDWGVRDVNDETKPKEETWASLFVASFCFNKFVTYVVRVIICIEL